MGICQFLEKLGEKCTFEVMNHITNTKKTRISWLHFCGRHWGSSL